MLSVCFIQSFDSFLYLIFPCRAFCANEHLTGISSRQVIVTVMQNLFCGHQQKRNSTMHVLLWIVLSCSLRYISGESGNITFSKVNGTVYGNQTLSRANGPYLVTSDLVILQNATLTVEAGTDIFLVPKKGIHVYGSLLATGTPSRRITFQPVSCNGTSFCNFTDPEDYYKTGIRLAGGTSYNNGRLELERDGQWGTICSDNYWDFRDAEVACRQLGFLGAKRYYRHPGTGPIWFRNVGCSGNEDSLWRCSYYGIGHTGCCKYLRIYDLLLMFTTWNDSI